MVFPQIFNHFQTVDTAMILVLNSLLSPPSSPFFFFFFTKRVASPVTMVTWHFMLTESTILFLQFNEDTRCIRQPVPATHLVFLISCSKDRFDFHPGQNELVTDPSHSFHSEDLSVHTCPATRMRSQVQRCLSP